MVVCVVCDQPLPLSRSDRLTCSDRCRSQRSRQVKRLQAPASPSRAFRLNLSLASPVRFQHLRPTTIPLQGDPQTLPVDTQCWDQTLEVLNQLFDLHYELGQITSWQGEEGHHPDPLVEEAEGNDVCEALLQHLTDARKLGISLQVVRGRAGRLLAPASRELAQQLDELGHPVRKLVTLHVAKPSPYVLVIDQALLQQVDRFQDWVSRWWFTLLEQG